MGREKIVLWGLETRDAVLAEDGVEHLVTVDNNAYLYYGR